MRRMVICLVALMCTGQLYSMQKWDGKRGNGNGLQLLVDSEIISFVEALDNVRIVEKMNYQLERNLPEELVMSYGFGRLK